LHALRRRSIQARTIRLSPSERYESAHPIGRTEDASFTTYQIKKKEDMEAGALTTGERSSTQPHRTTTIHRGGGPGGDDGVVVEEEELVADLGEERGEG
jgi:hypothetical protein